MKKPNPVSKVHRRMFLLFNKHGQSYQKVADEMGVSRQRVYQSIKYYKRDIEARQKYKAWLKNYKPEINPKTGQPNYIKPPSKKANPETHYFSRMMQTAEGREQMQKWRIEGGKCADKTSVPAGYTKVMMEDLRHQAQLRAKRMVKKIAEKNDINSEYAKQALETVAEIMQTPGSDAERLKASRVMLEFTQSKPVAKSEISVSKAEDFLASLVEDDD